MHLQATHNRGNCNLADSANARGHSNYAKAHPCTHPAMPGTCSGPFQRQAVHDVAQPGRRGRAYRPGKSSHAHPQGATACLSANLSDERA
eukprot:4418066-Alexandrium_andersonii.AAC.1